ncbi:sodium:solute symporter family protein [Bengtsoniella intestinalis]|uniref:sodium:solute symporter family protein n=1 Tax=Bengtsoniella intestinalis TaxID=3073143 RepID=UPI00391F2A96
MEHVTLLDIIIILVYLLFTLFIGFYFTRKVKNSSDFFIAGRSLGPVVLMATVCASIIGGSALIGRGNYAYTSGVVSIAIALPYMVGMFIFSGFTGRISKIGQKYGVTSIPELMELRFGKTAKLLAAAMIAYSMAATVGSQISATATVFSVIGGNHGITYMTGAIIATVIFAIYTASAGLFGVVYTDLVQFFILILFVYITLPVMAVSQVGGLSALIAQTPSEMFDFELQSSVVTLIFTNFVMTLAGAEFWQRAFAAKNPKTALRGQFAGTVVYAVTIFITLFLGLSAAILFPNLVNDYGSADYAIPVMVASILPIGLTGLTFAGLLSVMMSSADTCILVATQASINDIWKTIHPDLSEDGALKLSRIVTVLISGFALLVALFFTSAYAALMFAWTFYASAMGLPCLAALCWKKANTPGILSGMLTGLVVCIAWKLLGEPLGVGCSLLGVLCSGVALVAVTLATTKSHPPRCIATVE